MDTLQQDLKSVESRYGDDVLNLVIASGYLTKLTGLAIHRVILLAIRRLTKSGPGDGDP